MEQYTGKNAPAEKIPRVNGHAWDWIEAIRTGRQAGSNFDYGGPLTQVALLGLIAIRFPGQTLKWDDKAMKRYTAGGHTMAPKDMAHFASIKGETIVEVTGIGPFAIKYVDPNDDPMMKKTAAANAK